MNYSEKICALANKMGRKIPVYENKWILGIAWGAVLRGWLHIGVVDDAWYVTVARDEELDETALLFNPAYAAEFDKLTGKLVNTYSPTGVWKHICSIWPVRDPNEAAGLLELIETRIDQAYNYHFA